jgi:hypothetical protein
MRWGLAGADGAAVRAACARTTWRHSSSQGRGRGSDRWRARREGCSPGSSSSRRCCACSASASGCYPYAEVDEHIVTDRALGFLRGDLDPHYFAYPSLCFDLHGALAWLQFVLGRIGGRWASLAEFRAACWVDPGLVPCRGAGPSR